MIEQTWTFSYFNNLFCHMAQNCFFLNCAFLYTWKHKSSTSKHHSPTQASFLCFFLATLKHTHARCTNVRTAVAFGVGFFCPLWERWLSSLSNPTTNPTYLSRPPSDATILTCLLKECSRLISYLTGGKGGLALFPHFVIFFLSFHCGCWQDCQYDPPVSIKYIYQWIRMLFIYSAT